ncbi:Transposon Tf2-6 poly [Paramuricea clavata]|uniref:Transposon Tf2-6 poly n=1 Tax=Paramuricea clavata TaxID=317549 RepID=A0A7D9HS57_PARCT|nr:Transposon Tf2-6 poly [Paramuricea clavata]
MNFLTSLVHYDDIIVSGANTEEHDIALEKVLHRARERNIKFNKKKIQLRVTEVKYLGNIVSAKGFTPDPEKIKAIVELPLPKSKQDLQRLLGMVNYLSQYIPNMSEITAPLRTLLKKDIQWSWHNEHQKALERIKKVHTSSPVLHFYDIDKLVILQVDASQGGLGACLIQEGHPVIYASRSLTNADQHYAQVEKELLAIVFACERFNQFIYGTQVTVHSDHKPLEAIIAKPSSQAPPRIQRLLIRLQKYHPTVKYVPGKFLFIADTLSRAYLPDEGEQQELNEDIEVMVHSMVTVIPASPEKMAELKEETANDETLQQLKQQMVQGWADRKHEIPQNLATYWNIRHELSEAEGLIFKDHQLVIPTAMRSNMLNLIHESHLGIEKCKARARAILFWPGMSKDIYEKFIETALLPNKTAGTVIRHLKSIFARHGIPDELVSDNMPFNSKEFDEFAKEWRFKQTTSSPTYAQSNGMSEKAVQTVKRILKKADDPYVGLMEYRNTPVTGMTYSPSQLLMSRTTRTKIPMSKELLLPAVPISAQQQLEQRQNQQKQNYDKSTKPLPPLEIGENIHLRQDSIWVPATVSGLAPAPRSYIVTTSDGQQYRRNRRDLLKTNIPPSTIIEQTEDVGEEQPTIIPQPPDLDLRNPPNQGRPMRTTALPIKYRDYVMK